MTYALDFETFYDSRNGYGIKELGVWGYINHDLFDPYMVTVTDGTNMWEGRPEDQDWMAMLAGGRWEETENGTSIHCSLLHVDFVAHNAFFDRQVFARCQEIGLIPGWIVPHWQCTANMSAYLGGGRSLLDASTNLLGITPDKAMRAYMDGRQWDDVKDTEAGPKLREYARKDAELCWLLWDKFGKDWPEVERRASEITMQQCMRGVFIDKDQLERGMNSVLKAHMEAVDHIPWADKPDEKGKIQSPLSSLALKAHCAKIDVPVPASCADGDERFMEWAALYGEKVPVIGHMQTVRSSKVLYEKAKTLFTRIRPDGTYPFELKYWGGHTGRWSGGYEDDSKRVTGTGFNIQNLPRDEMYGLNLRHVILPNPGYKFISADYSQIEPRVLAWLIQDKVMLDLMAGGMSPYEAHARASMGWTGGSLKKENKALYQLAKARVLALGYGAGWKKFIFMAGLYVDAETCAEIFSAPVTLDQRFEFERYLGFLKNRFPEWLAEWHTLDDAGQTKWVNAWLIVQDYRTQNPLIADKERGIWHILESHCRAAVGKTFSMGLPSGRAMKYLQVRTHGGLSVVFPHSRLRKSIWGGFLTENIVQATSRDILRDALVNVEDAGIRSVFTVHDEIVIEVPKSFPVKELVSIMTRVPDWIPGLPIDVEAAELEHYVK